MIAVREWKRDRTQNVMSLDVAVTNLERHGVDGLNAKQINARLLAGLTIDTRLATFFIPAYMLVRKGVSDAG